MQEEKKEKKGVMLRRKPLIFHLLMMFCICGVLYVLFFSSLGIITGHGDEIKVPNVIGKDLRQAKAELEKMGFELKIDSTYEPQVKSLTVLDQQPEANFSVKEGRILFLTVNKIEPPKTAMPNLVGLSYRSAALILKNNRLLLGDTSYKPDIAKGAVLEQVYRGQKINAGTAIPQGSRIDLVIGDGLGETELAVPDMIGQPYEIALATLSAMGFQVTTLADGPIDDTATAIVLNQQPKAYNSMMMENRLHIGDIVDLTIKQNPTEEELDNNRSHGMSVDTSTGQ